MKALAVALAVAALTAQTREGTGVFATISSSLGDLSRITGFKTLKHVDHDVIGRERLKAFLEERIRDEIKPEEIRAEEIALKKFGLAPPGFDLKKTTVDLMTEQAAAFYDYRKKKLFLLEGAAGMEAQTVLVHELAHALADQHFNLAKYLRTGKTDDSSLARMAVMEGQATYLMYELLAERMGQSLAKSPAIAGAMEQMSDGMSAQFPVLASAPLYMRASLLFPYVDGLKFQIAVVQARGKDAFQEVFRRPPASTQQILHPERYLSGEAVRNVDLPPLEQSGEYRGLTGGSVGEFDHSVLIEQYLSKAEAKDLAPHWRGGSYAVMEHKKDRRTVLLYASEWDTEENAARMFDAYQKVLKGKWKNYRPAPDGAAAVNGEGDDGRFELRRNGVRITSVEGLKAKSGTGFELH